VVGEVEIARIEYRRGAGQALENRRFEIVPADPNIPVRVLLARLIGSVLSSENRI
jgi:hypothetical protein